MASRKVRFGERPRAELEVVIMALIFDGELITAAVAVKKYEERGTKHIS